MGESKLHRVLLRQPLSPIYVKRRAVSVRWNKFKILYCMVLTIAKELTPQIL